MLFYMYMENKMLKLFWSLGAENFGPIENGVKYVW